MNIALVAGLWLDASSWDEVVPLLRAAGHRPVPVTLPGQGDGAAQATLEDQVTAVVAAVDAAQGPTLIAAHSAACTLGWLAADARADQVAGIAMIGGFPTSEGKPYAPFFDVVDAVMPFPGWGPFEGPDSHDLDPEAKRAFEAAAIPVPEAVTSGIVHYRSEGRRDVPVVMVCPEYTPDEARGWVESGDLPELTRARYVEYVDIDSGHWPMLTRPVELARLLAATADALALD